MYINDNFLHAPSQDLSRETVKLLSGIMLAQAQECVCQTQMRDGKQGKTVAKLANQASMLYGSALEGINDQINQGIFERFWLTFFQVHPKTKAGLVSERTGQAKVILSCRSLSSSY
jgi:hypothetical protein